MRQWGAGAIPATRGVGVISNTSGAVGSNYLWEQGYRQSLTARSTTDAAGANPARLIDVARRGEARQGQAWRAVAGLGWATQGKVFTRSESGLIGSHTWQFKFKEAVR